MDKSAEAFRTIGEVAEELAIPKHVLRFWEGRFPQIRPMKRGGGRRYYRPEDMELLRGIRALLHDNGYTIRGVQKILRDQGVDQVKAAAIREKAPLPDLDSAASGNRKRGRKPIAAVVSERQKPDPAAKAESAGASVNSSSRKSPILAAIRELEIARAILLGKPSVQAGDRAEEKKSHAGRS